MRSGSASHVCLIPRTWSCTRRSGASCSVSLLGRDACRRSGPEGCFIVIASVTGCHSVITYTDIRWKLHALDSWAPRFDPPWSLNQGAGDLLRGLHPCPSTWYLNKSLAYSKWSSGLNDRFGLKPSNLFLPSGYRLDLSWHFNVWLEI